MEQINEGIDEVIPEWGFMRLWLKQKIFYFFLSSRTCHH